MYTTVYQRDDELFHRNGLFFIDWILLQKYLRQRGTTAGKTFTKLPLVPYVNSVMLSSTCRGYYQSVNKPQSIYEVHAVRFLPIKLIYIYIYIYTL